MTKGRTDWADLTGGMAIWLVLIALCAVGAVASENFLNIRNLLNVVRQSVPLGIAAIGVTFVMILGEVDLSAGALVSMSAVVCPVVMAGDRRNILLALIASCAVTTALGAVNGVVVGLGRASSFILTLGTAMAFYGLTQIVTGGAVDGIVAPGYREFFNFRVDGVVPVLVIAFAVVVLAGVLLQRRTVLARQLYLIGASRAAARLTGLPILRTTVLAYTISGFFAGLSGLALVARSGVPGSLGASGYEFDVLAAAVLGGATFEGGRGSVGSTVAGVLVLIVTFNLVNILGFDYHAQLIVKGAVIIGASGLYNKLRKATNS